MALLAVKHTRILLGKRALSPSVGSSLLKPILNYPVSGNGMWVASTRGDGRETTISGMLAVIHS